MHIDDSHRPWPLPARPWRMSMSWHDLAFLHWPVPAAALAGTIPPGMELDTFDGSAWLAVVPFRMSGVGPRYLPKPRFLSAFPELNLRTYVTADGKPGVWFYSLDAASKFAVRAARIGFRLPYFDARMRCERAGDTLTYASERTHAGAPPAVFRGRYRATGPALDVRPGSLEHFLTERYALYTTARGGAVLRGDIHHAPWPLQPGEVELEECAMTRLAGLEQPNTPPLVHVAERLDVIAWTLARSG